MSERLEQVKRFEDLRTGMLIVGKPCGRCGAAHRAIVMGPEVFNGRAAWRLDPVPRCAGVGNVRFCADTEDVAAGSVWRVVDDDITEVRRQIVRKKERAR